MSESGKQYRWYIIRGVSGKESKIKEYIEAESDAYSRYIEEVLIPKERVFRRVGTRKHVVDRLFYPGYIMIKACLISEVKHFIRSVPNVIGFLSDSKGGDPVPMTDRDKEWMIRKIDNAENAQKIAEISFYIGDTVKVIDGPFDGYSGVVRTIKEDKRRLEVEVAVFGRKTPVELSYSQVEKI